MKKIFFAAALSVASTALYAQRTPEHPLDIKDARFENLINYLDRWNAGQQPDGVSRMDDEFFISRVKPKERIKDGDYLAVEGVDANRKMCLWVPLDDPTVTWKSLPRYCFEGDNFSLWSYVDIHGNWTSPWFRSTAGISDVAAKNGVKVGCLWSIGWSQSVYTTPWYGYGKESRLMQKVTEKNNDGTFKNAERLVKLLKYYGINGIGVNSEFHSDQESMIQIQDFFRACHQKGKELGWDFQVYWYDGTNDNGQITFDNGLGTHNQRMFGDSQNVTTDMLFFNYNWDSQDLTNTEYKANQMGRSSYDTYAGFDIQGRGLTTPGYGRSWEVLKSKKISVGFWGAHAQSLIHQSATDNGTSDVAIQNAYLQKQELIFSGGNRNPVARPSINNGCNLSNASLKNFHGIAELVSAKSTIQTVPFVSRFNLGNGLKFRNEGEVTFDHKWYNLNTQDLMPTWRWWITDRNDQATTGNLSGLIKADLTFDEAYFGGSCLSLHGNTNYSRVKLFKTLLKVQPSYEFSITYKLTGEDKKNTHAKLFVALKGKTNEYKEIDIPAATKAGEWNTFTATMEELQIPAESEIAMLGIAVENTPDDYNMYVGEMAVRNPAQTFNTLKPEIKETQLLRGRYNALDFKVRYASKEETGDTKYYNDDVDTWYYEILFQEEGQSQMVLTATTSWAGYVIDAPLMSREKNRKARLGVRAVAPDGKMKSDISWSEWLDVPYNNPLTTMVIDKPVVKPNEQFTIKLLDELADPLAEIKIVDPRTGKTMASVTNSTMIQTTVPTIGLYDLHVKDGKGQENVTRGFVQITPEETGAVPQVTAVTADKENAKTDEQVKWTYTSKDGEGKVSRAIEIRDPQMFMIPGEIQQGKTYTYALWFKVDKFAHDKQGTNLINKNTVADKWPHNNWGDLWVQIRPEWKGNTKHPANEVSFNVMGWEAHDNPNEQMMSTGYSITPRIWNHIAVTQNESGHQVMYFNGKKVAETDFSPCLRRETRNDSRINTSVTANIFIGGGGVYKSGLNGWIDDVQVWDKVLTEDEIAQAMNGYQKDAVPEHLQGYYTFEERTDDSMFPNWGKAAGKDGQVVVMDGSGGENTSNASYKKQSAMNDALGYPGIVGSLDVKTTPAWTLDQATVVGEEGKTATVTYANAGSYSAEVKLMNRWGEASATSAKTVEISEATGIDNVNTEVELSVYPNPFAESVNLRFAQGGTYKVNILNAGGMLLQQNVFDAVAGEVANVRINGAKGVYFIQVMKNNKLYKSIKAIKR